MEDEAKILESIQAGNSGNFQFLYDAYVGKIYRFVYFKTRHKETAEDITSDVFIKALTKIKTYDSTKASFSVWLYRIARNSVIDHYRSSREFVSVEDGWDIASDEDVVKRVGINLELRQLEEYLKNLKPEQRDLVVLRVWQELSYKEISEIMHKDEGALRVSFSRIIGNMKKDFGISSLILLVVLSRNIVR